MTKVQYAVICLVFLAITAAAPRVQAQDHNDEFDENSRINTNVAFTLSAPLNPLAHSTNFGWGFVLGAGYNFSHRHAIVAEFLWNRLQPTPEALTPFRLALHSADINGHGNLLAWTANY